MSKIFSSRNLLLLGYALFVFCFVFNFTISFLSITSTAVLLFFCLGYVFFDNSCAKSLQRILAQFYFVHLILIILGVYGVLLSTFWGMSEVVFLGIFLKLAMSSLAAAVFVYCFRRDLINFGISSESDLIFSFLDVYFAACVIQSVFVVLSFVFPDFREFLNQIVGSRGNIDIDHPFRFRGLHDSGGFNLSLALGIAVVYGLYSALILERKAAAVRIASASLVLFSTTLVGRTGLMLSLLGIFLMIVFWPVKFFNLKSLVGIFLAFVFGVFVVIIFPEQFEFFNVMVFDYAFEAFVNYKEAGSVSTTSSDDLVTMLFIPDWFNVLFGNGSFDLPNAGVERSDSGYMKILLSSGIFGFLILYGILVMLALRFFRAVSLLKVEKFFFIFLLLSLWIAEIKGPVFIQNDVSRFLIILFIIAVSGRVEKTDK